MKSLDDLYNESVPSKPSLDEIFSSVSQPADDAPKEDWDAYYKRTVKPASGFVPQAEKAAYEGLPFGKRLISALPGGIGENIKQNMEAIQEPTDLWGEAGKITGQMIAAAPAMAVTGAALPAAPILSGALGFGAQAAGQASSEGATPLEAAGTGGFTAATSYVLPKAVIGAGKFIGRAIAPSAKGLTDEATKLYREILRPAQGEVKKIEVRGKKDINDFFKLAAEEGLKIEKVDNKLDTAGAVEALKPKISDIHTKLDEILAGDTTRQFRLNKLAIRAKNELTNTIKNADELAAAKSNVDELIKAEIELHGPKVTAQTLNRIKQGMWSRAYEPLAPNKNVVAQKLGHLAKESIERAFRDVNVKALNNLSGEYQTLTTLLNNAHGRVVRGGRLGNYFANLTGAVIGHGLGVPVLGEVSGAVLAGKIVNFIDDPAVASAIAANKALRAGIKDKSFSEVMGIEIEKDPTIKGAISEYAKKIGSKVSDVVENIKSKLPDIEVALAGGVGKEPPVASGPRIASTVKPQFKLPAEVPAQPPVKEANIPEIAQFRAMGKGGFADIGGKSKPQDFATAEELPRKTLGGDYILTAEDFELKPDLMKPFDRIAVKLGDKIYSSPHGKNGIYNHSDLIVKHNLMDKISSTQDEIKVGFLDRSGKFLTNEEAGQMVVSIKKEQTAQKSKGAAPGSPLGLMAGTSAAIAGGAAIGNATKANADTGEKHKADAEKYLKRFPKTPITAEMLQKAHDKTLKETGVHVPIELVLSQAQFETKFATEIKRPGQKTNPFNVGEEDKKTTKRFKTIQDGINAYYSLMARKYLKGKTADDLTKNFVNDKGQRYASDKNYETKIKNQMAFVRRYLDKKEKNVGR